jgi:putative oxidoreductase
MFEQLSTKTVVPVVLRLVLGAVFLVHGLAKLSPDTAWGTEWSIQHSTWNDRAFQGAVAWGEVVLGGVALILGVLTRPAAVGGLIVQLSAAYYTSLHSSFSTEIFSLEGRVGWEFNLCVAAMCLAVALLGAGTISLDYVFMHRGKAKKMSTAPAAISSLAPVA